MQKILGLDIGTYSIKAVILWNDYKNYRVHQLFEQKIEYSENINEKTAQSSALKLLFEQNEIEYDVLYAALDSRYVSIRKVDFENIRKRDIPGFLENELESTSPFAIEDSILDYQIIDYAKSKSSVLAVLCKKENIKDTLDLIEQENLRVKVIDIDNLTYLNMVSYLPHEVQAVSDENDNGLESIHIFSYCNLIINIGHSKTTLTFLNKKKVLFTRIISIAGDYFNQVLKQHFNLTYQEADTLKCFVASKAESSNQEDNSKYNLVSSILVKAISELCGEILRTIQSFQTKENIKIKYIYLTGGSSKIKGIYDFFERSLKVPIIGITLKKENFIFEQDDEPSVTSEGGPDFASFSQTLAIAMRGLPINGATSKINLRKGEFAQVSNYDKLIKQIFLYSSAIFIILFCLFTSYFFRSFMYNKEIDSLKNQFRKDVISMFSGEPYALRIISAKKDWDFQNYSEESFVLLKQSMKDKKQIIEDYSSLQPPYPLKILSQVSQAVPKDLYFEVSEFKVQDNQLYIEAETNNQDNIQKIIEKLSGIKSLNQVTKKSQSNKVGGDKNLIHFSLVAAIVKEEG